MARAAWVLAGALAGAVAGCGGPGQRTPGESACYLWGDGLRARSAADLGAAGSPCATDAGPGCQPGLVCRDPVPPEVRAAMGRPEQAICTPPCVRDGDCLPAQVCSNFACVDACAPQTFDGPCGRLDTERVCVDGRACAPPACR